MKSATLVDRARDSRTSNHTMLSSGFFSLTMSIKEFRMLYRSIQQFIINLTVLSTNSGYFAVPFRALGCSTQKSRILHCPIQKFSYHWGFQFSFCWRKQATTKSCPQDLHRVPSISDNVLLVFVVCHSHFYCSRDTLPCARLSHSSLQPS